MDNGLKKFFGWSAFIVVVLMLVLKGCVYALETHDDVLTVSELKWKRTINIEEYRFHHRTYCSNGKMRTRTYRRWDVVDKIVTEGDKDTKIKWGSFELKSEQREGSRIERFYISGSTEDGKIYNFDYDKEVWDDLYVGDKVSVSINRLGMVTGINR